MSEKICITAPFGSVDRAALVAAAEAALEACVILNASYLRQHPEIPPLYSTETHYRLDDSGTEEFLSVEEVYERGWGDCDQLACWRAAELRLHGVHASVRLRPGSTRPGDERIFHALVHPASMLLVPEYLRSVHGMAGGFEDPSALLTARNG